MIVTHEDRDLLIVDDFLTEEDLAIVTERGRSAEFVDYKAEEDGVIYKRVSPQHIQPVVDALTESMGRAPRIYRMGYRLNYEGELPNNEIHSDSGWGTHALVLYLSDVPNGMASGTGFWRHRISGADRIKAGEIELYEQVKNDWNNVAAWDLKSVVPSRINRATIYKTELFHSRWPFEAYGTTPEDGRLIVVAFFS
jgi:hypothetical protein